MKTQQHFFSTVVLLLILGFFFSPLAAQKKKLKRSSGKDTIDVSTFWDSSHHWYDINDEVTKIIVPVPGQKQYDKTEIEKIADNILLYQRSNGGWPKNYDMRAILTDDQKKALVSAKDDILMTTFDNGATHSQVEYLARVYSITKKTQFKEACLKGIDFILSAQYSNGGWPQFFPDTSGYRKYITFNDGAMCGVMKVLLAIVQNKSHYSFVDEERRTKVQKAFDKGLECILNCQIKVNDTLTAWCQQHNNITLLPQNARTFEPKAICSQESAGLLEFLMSIKNPSQEIINSVNAAVQWFEKSKIFGLKYENVSAPHADFQYHKADFDRIVVEDSTAPPIWARLYEIDTNKPIFCNRNGIVVYSLAEVERERRTGYAWYGYEAQPVLNKYYQNIRLK
jgi:PelA/Pel-15E family pectate lyase